MQSWGCHINQTFSVLFGRQSCLNRSMPVSGGMSHGDGAGLRHSTQRWLWRGGVPLVEVSTRRRRRGTHRTVSGPNPPPTAAPQTKQYVQLSIYQLYQPISQNLNQLQLSWTQFCVCTDESTLKVLEARKGEREAQAFLKLRRQREHKSQENRNPKQ